MIAYRFEGIFHEGLGQLNTVQSQLAFLANERNSASSCKLSTFLGKWEEALRAALKADALGPDIRYTKIFWIPVDAILEPCFIWTDPRDGSNCVVSKIELPWIKELADLYVPEISFSLDDNDS